MVPGWLFRGQTGSPAPLPVCAVCRPVGPVLCITDPERPPMTDVGSAVVPPPAAPAAAASPALGGGGSDKQL